MEENLRLQDQNSMSNAELDDFYRPGDVPKYHKSHNQRTAGHRSEYRSPHGGV